MTTLNIARVACLLALVVAVGCQYRPRVGSGPIQGTVTEATFDQDVLASDVLVLVDFAADWCGPCHMMEPVLKDLATDFRGRMKLATVDVDSSPKLAQRYGIEVLPTMVFVREGQEVGRIMGVYSHKDLQRIVEQHLAGTSTPAS